MSAKVLYLGERITTNVLLRLSQHEANLEKLNVELPSLMSIIRDERFEQIIMLNSQNASDEVFSRFRQTEELMASRNISFNEAQAILDQEEKPQPSTKISVNTSREVEPQITTHYSGIEKPRQFLMASLEFEGMYERMESIPDPLPGTFEWIFESYQSLGGNYTFGNWLVEGEDIFWIKGIPGSGKSTLMKFLVSSDITRFYLNQWAKSDNVIIASHFIWGVSGLAALDGVLSLFRSLLYEVLRGSEQLPVTYWDSVDLSTSLRTIETPINGLWTWEELKKCFRKVIHALKCHICLFVDGLDEIDPSLLPELDFLQSITSSNVKICVSGRDLFPFVAAFDRSPTVNLQEHNGRDIYLFAAEQIRGIFESLTRASLANWITQMAGGSFLWVAFVTNNLHQNLIESDTEKELADRLRAFPTGLQNLLDYLLNNIDLMYKDKRSQIFKIMVRASDFPDPESLCLLGLSFYDDIEHSFTKGSGADDIDLSIPPKLLTPAQIQQRLAKSTSWLNTLCFGLLQPVDKVQSISNKYVPLTNSGNRGIRYFHRIVKYYFESLIFEETPGKANTLSTPKILKRIQVFRLKTCFATPIETQDAAIWTRIFQQIIALEFEDERKGQDPDYELLDALSELATLQRGEMPDSECKTLLQYAITQDLTKYVASRLTPEMVQDIDNQNPPYLYFALVQIYWANPNMVSTILDRGADPNQVYKGETMWQRFLSKVMAGSQRNDNLFDAVSEIIKLLLDHGADIKASRLRSILLASDPIEDLAQSRTRPTAGLNGPLLRLLRVLDDLNDATAKALRKE